MNKTIIVLLSLMVAIGMIGLTSASNSAGNGENHEGDTNPGNEHEGDTNPGNEHEGDNGEGQQGEDDGDDGDTSDPASADKSSGGDGECHVTLKSPSNYNNTPHGEVIPALYTWQSAIVECTMFTTEYYPAPGEFIGAVLCTPERISGESQTNYWNTPKMQRILRWKASAQTVIQDD